MLIMFVKIQKHMQLWIDKIQTLSKGSCNSSNIQQRYVENYVITTKPIFHYAYITIAIVLPNPETHICIY